VSQAAFSRDWLALREPFDLAARAAAWQGVDLAAAASDWRGGASTLQVIDLACGSGANLRALAPRLQGAQRWTLVDHDPALLAAVPAALQAWAAATGCHVRIEPDAVHLQGDDWHAEVQLQACDLATGLAQLPLTQAHLVTASALLDLVSARWLDALLAYGRHVPAWLFALSVDGRIDWAPADPDDGWIDQLFGAHQSRDKGFGPALGGAAPLHATRALESLGCTVQSVPSDWDMAAERDGADRALLQALIDGMAQAATEQAPAARTRTAAWRQRREALVTSTRLNVGHLDLLATRVPPA